MDGEWQTVSGKKLKSSKSLTLKGRLPVQPAPMTDSEIIQSVNKICKSIPTMDIKSLDGQYDLLVSVGIGSFSTSPIALNQLAGSVWLQRHLSIPSAVSYDPVNTTVEKTALDTLRQPYDSGYMHKVQKVTSGRVLFFMPHCDKEVYLDVMEKCVDRMDKITIIGNDFKNYVLTTTSSEAQRWKLLDSLIDKKRFELMNYFQDNVFNDTVVIHFQENARNFFKN